MSTVPSGAREALRRRAPCRAASRTPAACEPAHVVEVEVTEARVARELAAKALGSVAELGAAVEQREHLRDDLGGVGRRGGRRRGRGALLRLRERVERPLRVGEPGAQRLELVAGRRAPVGDVHHAQLAQRLERPVAVAAEAEQRQPLHA